MKQAPAPDFREIRKVIGEISLSQREMNQRIQQLISDRELEAKERRKQAIERRKWESEQRKWESEQRKWEAARRKAEEAREAARRKAEAARIKTEEAREAARRKAEAARIKTEEAREAARRKAEAEAEAERKKEEKERRKAEKERIKTEEAQRKKRSEEREREIARITRETEFYAKQIESRFGNRWGELIEALIEGNAIDILNKRGIKVQRLIPNYTGVCNGDSQEYDLIAINGIEAVVIETKSHLTKQKTNQFLKKLRDFKRYCPEFSALKIYGAVACLRARGEALAYAESQGLFVIRVSGKNAIALNKKSFRPKIFG